VVGAGVFLQRAQGQVKMTRVRIGTDLDCQGAVFTSVASPVDPAFDAGGISVEGSVFLRNGFSSKGLVLLHGAKIGLNLDCLGGRFEILGHDETVLNFDLSTIGGTAVLSSGFLGEGIVRLISSQIEGDLRCDGATFERGLVAERSVVKGALYWRNVANPNTVSLDLLHTSVDSLSDDIKSWPARGNLQLHGFVYSQIALSSERSATARLDWLSRLKAFTPQPYRQLAKVLKDEGDDLGARQVLYKLAEIRAQESERRAARAWSYILKYGVGYGYYPGRALLCLGVLALAGFVLYWSSYCAGIMVPTDKDAYTSFRNDYRVPDYYERFHPLVYSVENSFPLVRLGQVDRWQPEPSSGVLDYQLMNGFEFLARSAFAAEVLRAFRWIQIVLGWFFTTLGIAGVTGLVRRD
jgi:hypothetical protein